MFCYLNSKAYHKRGKKDEVGEKLVASVGELVNMRKTQATTVSADLKFQSMYANLDRMLSKLPDEAVEDLNLEFVRLAHEKLKEFRESFVTE